MAKNIGFVPKTTWKKSGVITWMFVNKAVTRLVNAVVGSVAKKILVK